MQRDSAFDQLFTCEFARCVRTAQRITGNADLARDLASEAFARAWARWPRLREQRPGAWVITVTVNLSIDALRKRASPATPPSSPTPSPEWLAITRSTLTSALDALPTMQRRAITLRYVEDYSEDAVAAALGVSRGTVKTHLHRGVKRLRRVLTPADQD